MSVQPVRWLGCAKYAVETQTGTGRRKYRRTIYMR
jgi:hypothetical protein